MDTITDDFASEHPPFMRELPSGWTDFWCPDYASTDHGLNLTLGELYADMAVRHAREKADPMALELVMTVIKHKAIKGEITIGPIEIGFFHRIAQLAYVGSLS